MNKIYNNNRIHNYSLIELKKLAKELAINKNPPFSVLLSGEMGSGKTTFAKYYIESILFDKGQKVTSPTFNIVQVYDTNKGQVWHVDLYRIKNKEEIFELSILEAMMKNICLIEWPGLLTSMLHIYNYNYITINFS